MLLHSAACYSSAWVLKDCIHPFGHVITGEPRTKVVLGWDMIARMFPELVFSRIQSILWKRQPTFCSTKIQFVQIGFVFHLMQITLHDCLSPLSTSFFLWSYLLVLQLQFYSYIWIIQEYVGSSILPGSPRHCYWWLMAAFHHLSFSTYWTCTFQIGYYAIL